MKYIDVMKFLSTFNLSPSFWAFTLVLTVLAGLATTSVHGDAVKILPVDEAAQNPDFLAFRDGLLAAVRRRDLDAVVAVAARNIKLSFGGSYGRAQFRNQLVADDNGEGGSYWEELEWALKLGGVFNGEQQQQFCTPYVSCSGPHQCTECDPFETLVAVTDKAPVYSAADASSPVLTHLYHDVVTLVKYATPWHQVQLADGRSGYVTFPDFRSPIGYRAHFEKREGHWWMRIFIAGD